MHPKEHNQVTLASMEKARELAGPGATFGDIRAALKRIGHSDRDLRFSVMGQFPTGRVLINKPRTSPKWAAIKAKEEAKKARTVRR